MSNSALVQYAQATGSTKSLRDLLVVLYRRRVLVLGIAGPIVAMGIYGALVTVAHYTASSEIRIEARSIEEPAFQQRPVEYEIIMSGAAQVAQSIPVADKAVAAVWDSLPAYAQRVESLQKIRDRHELRDVILSGVQGSQIGESNLLRITYQHEDPAFALLVVGAVTKAFIAYNIEKGRNSSAIEYYDDQISKAEAEIDTLLAKRVAVFAKSGLSAFEVNTESGIQNMRGLEASYYKAKSNRLGAQDRYNGVVAAIEADVDYMPSLSTAGQNANIIDARASYDKAVLALAQLRMTYQESSPHIQRQLEYVNETRRIFHGIRADFVRDLKINVDIALAEEQSLEQSLGQYRAGIEQYPALQRELYSIDLQVEARRELLKSLQTKRGEVRLKVQGDERISNIIPLNAPTLMMGVSSSKKFLYLALASLFAVVLSVLVAFAVDAQDHRIFDRRQAEDLLELPVLGAISPDREHAGRT